MKELTYSQTRQNLKQVILDVTENHEQIRIINRNSKSAILIDEGDYNSLLETAYLLRSPENAKKLIDAKNRSFKNSINLKDAIKELNLWEM